MTEIKLPEHISASQVWVWQNEGREMYACKYMYGFKDDETKQMIEGKAFEELILSSERGEEYRKLRKKKEPLKDELVAVLGEDFKKMKVDELHEKLLKEQPGHELFKKVGGLSQSNKDIEIMNWLARDLLYPFGQGQLQVEMRATFGNIELLGFADFIGIFNGEKAIVDVKYTGQMKKWSLQYAMEQIQKDMYPLIQDLNNEEVLPFYYFVCGWDGNKPDIQIFRYKQRMKDRGYLIEALKEIKAYQNGDEWKVFKHDEVYKGIEEDLKPYLAPEEMKDVLFNYISIKNDIASRENQIIEL